MEQPACSVVRDVQSLAVFKKGIEDPSFQRGFLILDCIFVPKV